VGRKKKLGFLSNTTGGPRWGVAKDSHCAPMKKKGRKRTCHDGSLAEGRKKREGILKSGGSMWSTLSATFSRGKLSRGKDVQL